MQAPAGGRSAARVRLTRQRSRRLSRFAPGPATHAQENEALLQHRREEPSGLCKRGTPKAAQKGRARSGYTADTDCLTVEVRGLYIKASSGFDSEGPLTACTCLPITVHRCKPVRGYGGVSRCTETCTIVRKAYVKVVCHAGIRTRVRKAARYGDPHSPPGAAAAAGAASAGAAPNV